MSKAGSGMDSCQAGEWVQSEVETCLLRNRQVVAPVRNASAPYDLIWDRGVDRLRIQIKKGRVRDGVICFTVNPRGRNAKGIKSKSYVGKIDAFIVYVPEIDRFYFVPIEDAPRRATHMRLRLAPRRTGGGKKSSWATEYEMRFDLERKAA